MLTDSIYELIIHWHVRSRKKKEKEKYDTVGGRRRADLIDSN